MHAQSDLGEQSPCKKRIHLNISAITYCHWFLLTETVITSPNVKICLVRLEFRHMIGNPDFPLENAQPHSIYSYMYVFFAVYLHFGCFELVDVIKHTGSVYAVLEH